MTFFALLFTALLLLIFFVFAKTVYTKLIRLILFGEKTTGIVKEVKLVRDHENDLNYVRVIEFYNMYGNLIEFESEIKQNFIKPNIGDEVKIYYDPNNNIKATEFDYIMVITLVFILAIFIGISFIAYKVFT